MKPVLRFQTTEKRSLAVPMLLYYVLHPWLSPKDYRLVVQGRPFPSGLGPIVEIPRFVLKY